MGRTIPAVLAMTMLVAGPAHAQQEQAEQPAVAAAEATATPAPAPAKHTFAEKMVIATGALTAGFALYQSLKHNKAATSAAAETDPAVQPAAR